MKSILARNWWVLALRSLIAVIFGLAVIIWPNIALTVIVLFFGIYALVAGICAIVVGVFFWPLLLEGLTEVVISVLVFRWTGITTLVFLYLIAAWALVTGIWEIVAGFFMRIIIERAWILVLNGILSLLLGVFLVIFPMLGAHVLLWLIGACAILFGILLFVLALRLRKLGKKPELQSVKTS